MQENLKRMQAALTEWLIKEEIIGDAHFYSIEEWIDRKEPYLDDSCLVLVFDSSTLHTILNYGGDTEEFDELIESFGFWYELGHSWNLGFYPVDGYDFSPSKGTYSQKLQDARWRKKAEYIKSRVGHQCQDCGARDRLEAHHCYYLTMREGYEPWEYPLSAFRALCAKCHASREKNEIRMRAFMAGLTQNQMDRMRLGMSSAFYSFKPDAVFDFISALGHSDERLYVAMDQLIKNRIET